MDPQPSDREKYVELVAKLEISALRGIPVDEQIAIVDRAAESANAKNRAGPTLPLLLLQIVLAGATFLPLYSAGLLKYKWVWVMSVPVFLAEYAGSLYLGRWTWNRRCRAEFRRSILEQLNERVGET